MNKVVFGFFLFFLISTTFASASPLLNEDQHTCQLENGTIQIQLNGNFSLRTEAREDVQVEVEAFCGRLIEVIGDDYSPIDLAYQDYRNYPRARSALGLNDDSDQKKTGNRRRRR